MPLRGELNAEILSWLTPTSLRNINQARKTRGLGHPDDIIESMVASLESPTFDYEVLLADWENRFIEGGPRAEHYHRLYAWLGQVVSTILFRRQVSNRDAFRSGLSYYSGIVRLARKNLPLWIFSLNHDLLVECVAAHLGIPLQCGFTNRMVALPCRRGGGRIIAIQQANLLGEFEMVEGQLPFHRVGELGINLLKLRGSLDVFGHGERNELIKLKPADETFDAIIDALQIANEGLLDEARVPDPSLAQNQIPYVDEQGNLQVLRRTLLASATRFGEPFPRLQQRRFLEYFRANLSRVSRLVAIGYGMGDEDVNEILTDWLSGKGSRRLEIVGPCADNIPAFLAGHTGQTILTPSSTTTYLEKIR